MVLLTDSSRLVIRSSMHPDLSPHLHSEECNELISKLHNCHKENKFLKFIGVCNDIDSAVWKCMKAERLEKRKKNQMAGEERRKKLFAKLEEGHTWRNM